MKQQIIAQILWNDALGNGYYRLGLRCPTDLSKAKPGQFIMLQVDPGRDPLLKRPFSIHRMISPGPPAVVEILYKSVGRGTALLSRCQPGTPTEILAPLGKGFKVAANLRRIYIAAGGIGVAPMAFLVDQLLARGYRSEQLVVFLGASTRDDLVGGDGFRQQGLQIHYTTDDGSAGDQCLITDPLALAVARTPPDLLLACGPNPMLACVIGIAEAHGLPCQISVEAHMACGVGACLGCAVPTRNGPSSYLHVCLNGPVFPADAIRLE